MIYIINTSLWQRTLVKNHVMRITLDEETIAEAINQAIGILREGGTIAYPTETFYALGVKCDLPRSLKRLYELKKRPREKAMPVIIGRRAVLSGIVSPEWLEHIPPFAQSLMDRFWPGPLTLLFPAQEGLPEDLTAGTGMIAVRMPGESFALPLTQHAGFPITATSANLSGTPPADSAEMVVHYFGKGIDLVIDGGQTPGGLPSTIVDVSGGRVTIVREGAITRDEIERFASQVR
jgi:L-threonylcarbamoyladenylate synthase